MGSEVALGMQGFGLGTQTIGAFFNASGQKTALNAQADVDEINAKLAGMSAQSALLAGQRQEQAVMLDTGKLKAAQKTAFAANGISLTSGSALSVLTTTDVLGKVDAATVAANAARTAFGYQSQAVSFKNQAIGARASASAINPLFAAGSSFIEGAGQVASSWYKLKKEGAFGSTSNVASNSYGPQNDIFARTFGQHNLVSNALY
jgi:hypothetical protein